MSGILRVGWLGWLLQGTLRLLRVGGCRWPLKSTPEGGWVCEWYTQGGVAAEGGRVQVAAEVHS